MSDLSIPGVTDKYSTQKVIDALMAAKREPLTRMQAQLTVEQQKKSVWQDITRKVSGLRDTARTLYGFQNPFNDRVAASSDERTLTGTATRQAVEETKKILVKKVATADRFLSKPLPRDFTVDPGQYTFKVGDKQVSLNWKGGSLRGFADALNTKGGDLLSASVVNDSTTTQVLLVEGKLTGSTSRLSFLDKAVDLAVKSGMVQRAQTGARQLALDQKTPAQWTKPLAPDAVKVQAGVLTVSPGAELKIPVSPSVALNKNMILELSVKVEKLPEAAGVEATPPPGPSVPSTGGIDFKGVHVESAPSETPLPEWNPPKPPENITDLQSLFMEGDGKVIPLPPVPDAADYQKIQVPVGEMASTLDALEKNKVEKIE